MKRFLVPRIAHCGSGHGVVPGTTENCLPRRGCRRLVSNPAGARACPHSGS